MPRRFPDLSIFLEHDVLSEPPLAPKIEYQPHQDTIAGFLDAPCHFYSTMNRKPGVAERAVAIFEESWPK